MLRELVAFELESYHRQVLYVHAQQKDPGAALDDIGLASVATLHLALV